MPEYCIYKEENIGKTNSIPQSVCLNFEMYIYLVPAFARRVYKMQPRCNLVLELAPIDNCIRTRVANDERQLWRHFIHSLPLPKPRDIHRPQFTFLHPQR